jgi:hypothetical protein
MRIGTGHSHARNSAIKLDNLPANWRSAQVDHGQAVPHRKSRWGMRNDYPSREASA